MKLDIRLQSFAFLPMVMMTGCFSNWKSIDVDGDGLSPFEGDCWDASEPPPNVDGALPHSLNAKDIFPGAFDLPYDGIDANCDGRDDFDADEDGWVPEAYLGIPTLTVEGSGVNQNSGDCWDNPELVLEVLNGFSALTAVDVNNGADERWYDGIDQNCDLLSDFDQDGDGQETTEYNAGLDCNDIDAEIYDGAIEIFYDGIDQDCRGGNDCDADSDGYPSSENGQPDDICPSIEDCDDSNADIFPDSSISEIFYNGIDDDCNPQTGDGDSDGDGHWANNYDSIVLEAGLEPLEDPNDAEMDCWDLADEIAVGFSALAGFEQLSAAEVSPSATEDLPYDGIDARCDGDAGEFDYDFDGYDSLYFANREGLYGTDCVDQSSDPFADFDPNGSITPSMIFPSATDSWYDGVDQNCDGQSDYDMDGDGYDAQGIPQLDGMTGNDCNDLDSLINPSASEQALDGIDQDCDGFEQCYADTDGDGYGSTVLMPSVDLSCLTGGVAANSDDCDDAMGSVYPLAVELPSDGVDQDCDGLEECYLDSDNDGFGSTGLALTSQLDCIGNGFSSNSQDCNDSDSNINPIQQETCDGVDSNCSGNEQDATDLLTWYADGDGDGFGDPNTTQDVCNQPTGYVSNTLDCNDLNALVNPAEPETCDGVDSNCSGNEQDATDLLTWYADTDADGFGDINNPIEQCLQPSGYVGNMEDCNDLAILINPSVTETCDGVDSNCSGDEQDAINQPTWFADTDNDGFGDTNTILLSCDQPQGYVDNGTDCAINDAAVNPGAGETCDGVDTNCSGDEQDATDQTVWYLDADSDGYGSPNANVQDCVQPSGFVISSDDCNDSNPAINTDALEICDNGVDEDCDPGNCEWQNGEFSDQTFYTAVEGTDSSSFFGMGIASYDVDLDGNSDYLAIGEAYASGNNGMVYITADPLQFDDITVASQRLKWDVNVNKRNGYTVDVRDIDQNGTIEVLAGTHHDERGYMRSFTPAEIQNGGTITGVEYLIDGTDNSMNNFSVAENHFIGDQDGDGIDDIIVGAPNFKQLSKKSGGIFLLSGSTVLSDSDKRLIIGDDSTDQQSALFYADGLDGIDLGLYMTTSDINDDGFDDLIAGEPNRDCVYIIYGPFGTIQSNPINGTLIDDCSEYQNTPVQTPVAGDMSVIEAVSGNQNVFGKGVDASEDINGDGYPDIVVTDFRSSGDIGSVFVFTGGLEQFYTTEVDPAKRYMKVDGTFTNERFGMDAALVPSLEEGTGTDLVITSNFDSGKSGGLFVFHSPQAGVYSADDADLRLQGETNPVPEGLGAQVMSLGDLDGNGRTDLLISTTENNSSNNLPGKVYILSNITD